MKKSIVAFLFVFTISSFFTSMAFAGDPIPGVLIGLGKNPGGLIAAKATTDTAGKFNLAIDKKGKYDLVMSYEKMIEMIGRVDKNKASHKNGYIITLTLDGGEKNNNTLDNGAKMPIVLVITKNSKSVTVNVPVDGGAISGRLTYEPVKRKGEK